MTTLTVNFQSQVCDKVNLWGAWLLQHSPSLEGIYASSSARTKSTTQFICAILNIKEGINFDLDYYQASRKMMVEKLCQISTRLKNIFIVAHNPGVTQLLNFLCPNQAAHLDPADIVHIEFNEIAWNEITEDSGIFVRRVSFRDQKLYNLCTTACQTVLVFLLF